jgi:hypothetical protein
MFQLDPWEKAAECQRALQAEADSTHRQILTNLRDLWIELANERSFLTRSEFDQQIEAIGGIHAYLIKSVTTRIH